MFFRILGYTRVMICVTSMELCLNTVIFLLLEPSIENLRRVKVQLIKLNLTIYIYQKRLVQKTRL